MRLEDILQVKSGENLNVRGLQEKDKYPIYGGNGINGYYCDFNVGKSTVIIGRVGFYCGSIHLTKSKAWVTDNALIVNLYSDELVKEWLYYVLLWCNIRKTSNSTAQPVVSGKSIYPLWIPLPSLQEQNRIVEGIESWFSNLSWLEDCRVNLYDSIDSAKSKILELAMQGELVPQDPADEPAADMLRRINPKAEIITDNPHYPQLPDNWAWVSMDDINEYRPKSANPAENPNDYFELYSVPIFPTGEPEIIIGKEIGSTKQSVRKGDVLLCKINPHINRVWSIDKDSPYAQIASSEWIVIRAKDIYTSYLRLVLSAPSFRHRLCSQVSGVGGSLTRAQPAVVKKYLLPIAPIQEQIRIVEEVEKLFGFLDKIQSNLSE